MVVVLALLLQDPIQEWVKQLGAEESAVRDAATENLKKAGARAVGAVRAAAKSADPEVSARARSILETLMADAPRVKAEREATEAARKIIAEKQITVEVVGALQEAARSIGAAAGLNVHVDPVVSETVVALKFSSLPVESVLKLAMGFGGASTEVYHGIVIVIMEGAELNLPGPSLTWMSDETLPAAAQQTIEALGAPTTVDKAEVPLGDLVASLTKRPVAVNLDPMPAVSVSLKDVPAHVVLRLACRDAGATWRIADDGTIHVEKKP